MSPLVLTKLPGFLEHLPEGVHDFSSDILTLALSNSDPATESVPPASSTAACVLANVTEISSYANLSSRTLSTAVVTEPEIVAVIPQNITLTATGAVPTFRWVYVFNASSTSPSNPLIGHYDLGSGITLADTDTLTLEFDPDEGFLTVGDDINNIGFYYKVWARQTYGWESLVAIDWWAE